MKRSQIKAIKAKQKPKQLTDDELTEKYGYPETDDPITYESIRNNPNAFHNDGKDRIKYPDKKLDKIFYWLLVNP